MSTLTFEMPTEQAEALALRAERRGLSVADLLREMAEHFLARDEAFETAAKHVLAKNAELYRRLAK